MDPIEIIATYGSSWNEPDEEERTALLELAWTDDGTYEDPMARADGRAALIAHIGAMQQAMPGHTIEQRSGVDVHGSNFRFLWVMLNGTEVVLEGEDFGEFAPDGRVKRITGFFGAMPLVDA